MEDMAEKQDFLEKIFFAWVLDSLLVPQKPGRTGTGVGWQTWGKRYLPDKRHSQLGVIPKKQIS